MIEILNLRATDNPKVFIVNGLHEVGEADENYPNVLKWVSDGKEVMPPLAPSEIIATAIQHFEDMATAHIENKVKEYNLANGLAFKDIDAFPKYAINQNSVHCAIANRFIAYADSVWSAVRSYQATLTAIPTDAEFKAVLDGVTF